MRRAEAAWGDQSYGKQLFPSTLTSTVRPFCAQEDTLRRQLMSKEEMRTAVGEAIKMQAGNIDLRRCAPASSYDAMYL